MKKEEIYVVIDDEQKRQRAIQILTDAREAIDWSNFELGEILKFDSVAKDWFLTTEEFKESLQETTLDQLDELLNPKEEPIKLDALKLIAESYGFELVEKKQTAVKWLFLMMNQAFANKLFEKAKELEKQQLQEAFEKGQLSTHKLA